MENNKPTVSVVMAVHNGEDFIRETLNSIKAQTFTDFECIIINDFSTDSTSDILKEYESADPRFKVFENEVNLKLAKSLNKGVELATGKYIVRMDADDICLENRFYKQVEFMDANPDVGVCYCKFFTLRDGEINIGSLGRKCDSETIKAMFLFFNPVLHPGVMARAEVMKQYLYDPECTCTEDYDIWTRMVEGGVKFSCVDEYLMLYRLHGNSITSTTKDKQMIEVKKIVSRFYKSAAFELNEEELDFFMTHIYFREKSDMNGLYDFYQKLLNANREKKYFDEKAIFCAFFEILADSTHAFGYSFTEKIKLSKFGLSKFFSEVFAKKKRAKDGVAKAVLTATSFGFTQKSTNAALPAFKYKEVK